MQVRFCKKLVLISVLFLFVFCKNSLQTGLDQVGAYSSLFKGKRIGIVTNHTAVNNNGVHISKIFQDMDNVQLVALFGPEHGVYGNAADGQKIESKKEGKIPVYSLYGKTKKPTAEMLKNIDLLVFDIQDIGARYYTYVWTLSYVMDAADENNIPLVVLDRPNPINGKAVEGNVADTSSFVGRFPVSVRHGMTIGEMAKMFKGEGWAGSNLDLTVVPLKNWQRRMWFDQTGLKLVAPSPNMPDLETATIYPGMCLLEGTNLSEGRGTDKPFKIFGAPWVNSKNLREYLEGFKMPGVLFKDTTFTPITIPGKAVRPKFENELCDGLKIMVTDRDKFNPYRTGVFIVQALHKLYPQNFQFKQKHFDRLIGNSKIRQAIQDGATVKELERLIAKGLDSFKQKREKYLMY